MPAKRKIEDKPQAVPQPTPSEARAIVAARAAQAARPERVRVKMNIKDGTAKLSNPHADYEGWGDQTREAFGTRSEAFTHQAFQDAINAVGGGQRTATEQEANAILSLMEGIAPQNELEAVMGVQIAAAHAASLDFLNRARANAGTSWEVAAAYTGMATKASRTMAVQIEALSKLRSGGKQTVEVRYVHVDARGGQYIIRTDVGGGGERNSKLGQPHVPSLPFAPSAEVWCEDAGGLALSAARDAEQAALPASRREEPRRPKGRSQRAVSDREIHAGTSRRPRSATGDA